MKELEDEAEIYLQPETRRKGLDEEIHSADSEECLKTGLEVEQDVLCQTSQTDPSFRIRFENLL